MQLKETTTNNRKDIFLKLLLFGLIFTFPFAAKLNLVSFGSINLYAFRIILIISFFYLIITKNLVVPSRYHNRWFVLFLLWILVYGVISLIWSGDKMLTIRHISYVGWGSLTFIVIYSMCLKLADPMKVIIKAWMIVFVIMAVFAFIEIGTSAHFEGTFTYTLSQLDTVRETFNSPLATFVNPNDFAAFLVFTLVFFLVRLGREKRLLPAIFVGITVFIVYYTRSVLAMYAIYWVVAAAVFLFLYAGNRKFLNVQFQKFSNFFRQSGSDFLYLSIIAAMIIFGVIFSVLKNSIVIPQEGNQVSLKKIEKTGEDVKMLTERMVDFYFIKSETKMPVSQTKSFSTRKNLILNGIVFLQQSYFMGAGAGQFEYKIRSGKAVFPTDGKTNPHNFFIEVLSQYGVISIVLISVFFIKILLLLLKNFKRFFNDQLSTESSFLLMVIPAYLIVSNGPSTFISMPMNWIILTIIAYSAEVLLKNRENVFDSVRNE